LEQIDPGRHHRAQRRQGERGNEPGAGADFPRQREQEQWEVSQQRRLHATLRSTDCAAIADLGLIPGLAAVLSLRLRPGSKICRPWSLSPFFLKTPDSPLWTLVRPLP